MSKDELRGLSGLVIAIALLPLAISLSPLIIGLVFMAAPFLILWECFKGVVRDIVKDTINPSNQ
jgi:hypothetical protein